MKWESEINKTMKTRNLSPRVRAVGAIDWHRRLFDELIPLPDGTTYNSYLVRGSDATALIDTVDPTCSRELFANLKEAGVDKIDYLVANHAEQDHSGTIPAVLERFPGVKVVSNAKCRDMLIDLLDLNSEDFITVADGDTLSLGDLTLEFMITPWVHWPETMMTYLRQEKILFSCDFLGSHLAQSSTWVSDRNRTRETAKRYYAEIMMPFRHLIPKYLERIAELQPAIIAPSHGPVHQEPALILEAYEEWVNGPVVNKVLIPFVSMHGSTAAMVDHLVSALAELEIPVIPFNLTVTDLGTLAIETVDAATIIIASPTVLGGPHPAVVSAAYFLGAVKPKTRYLGVIASQGWGGRLPEVLAELTKGLKSERLPTVMAKGFPKNDDFRALDELAEAIAAKHRDLGQA